MNTSTFRLRTLTTIIARTEQKRTALVRIACGIITLLAFGLSSIGAHAQDYNESLLYSFNPANTADGYGPQAPLINVNGIFYGTTYTGGSTLFGTIYSFNPSTNTETTLYGFSRNANNGNGGLDPYAGLVYDSASGKIFGTTYQGGTGGDGTIFAFDPSTNTVSFPYSFKNNGDGAQPDASMIDINGTLYGITAYGGTANAGTVFSYNITTNSLKTLHNFNSNAVDGRTPLGDLTYDSASGLIYGTTQVGGSNNAGTIFSIKPDGTGYQVLYSFGSNAGNPSDGNGPGSGLTEISGIFYGTTQEGGTAGDGTVYAFDPTTNTETTLYSFQGNPNGATSGDGSAPLGDLTYDSATGELFGTTHLGGIPGAAQNGTVFAIKPDGTGYNVVYFFQGGPTDGSNPYLSGLLDVSGTLYGTTNSGGANGQGAIFSLTATTFTLPHAVNDAYAPKYQTPYAVKAPGVLGNDNTGGSNKPTATLVTNVTHGTLTLSSNGSFTYTPANGFLGTDSFTYYVTNPFGQSNTATVTLNVQAMAPVTHTDLFSTTYNTTLTVAAPGVLVNDNPGDNAAITTTLVSSPSHGTLTFHSDGSFSYTPNTGFLGTDVFSYNATNDIGTSNTAPVNIRVQASAPIAANDSYAPQYQTAYVVSAAKGVLANDNAGGSSTLTPTLVSTVTHGSLTLNKDGSFTYTPADGFVGTDSFTYYDTNSVGTSNTATATFTVHTVAPVAHTDTYTVTYNTPLTVSAPGVLADDYPGSPGTLTAALVSNPSHGTVSLNSDGSFTYTPNSGYIGSDSFTYNATNALGTSNTAPVNLTVQPALPKAANDTYAPQYQTPYAVHAPGVLANDNAGGSSTLSASLVSAPTHGGLTFNSDGSFTYTPNSGFVGTDTFTYQAVNATGSSNVATVSLVVASMAPLAANDSYAPRYATAYAVKAPGVLANDNAEGGGTMTAALVSNPSNGSLTFNANGSFTYTPNSGFVGTDTFTYTDTNSVGTSNTATVTLKVTAVVPIAGNDAYTVAHNTLFAVKAPGVLANDYAGGTGLIAIQASQPAHGTLTFNSDGSFTYTPNTGYTGSDAFIYYDSNSVGTSNTATVTLTVQ